MNEPCRAAPGRAQVSPACSRAPRPRRRGPGAPRLAGVLALAGVLVAATAPAAAERDTSVVNTSGVDGAPVASRLHRLLDSRGVLAAQPAPVIAALEGQPIERPDLAEVRQAFGDFRYQDAERVLEARSAALLASASVEALKPLAEVLWWQGLVASVDDRDKPAEQRRKSKLYFAAAFALDEELAIDATVTPPRVRLLMDEARRDRAAEGRLQLEVGTEGVEVSIDGGPSTQLAAELPVPAGLHVLRVSAPRRSAVLRLVEVPPGGTVRLAVELPPEAKPDKVRRLVSESASVPEGKPRMAALAKLSDLVGVERLLLVESVVSQRAKIRLYDVAHRRMSQQFSFARSDSASTVSAALDRALRLEGVEEERRWYQRWQVWAGVGAGVGVVVIALVVSANREPRVQGL